MSARVHSESHRRRDQLPRSFTASVAARMRQIVGEFEDSAFTFSDTCVRAHIYVWQYTVHTKFQHAAKTSTKKYFVNHDHRCVPKISISNTTSAMKIGLPALWSKYEKEKKIIIDDLRVANSACIIRLSVIKLQKVFEDRMASIARYLQSNNPPPLGSPVSRFRPSRLRCAVACEIERLIKCIVTPVYLDSIFSFIPIFFK